MRSPDGVHFDMPDTAAAVRVPDLRLPARVLQQPDRVGAARLHAVRRRRLPDLATRPRRGARRLVARRSPARTSSSRSASTVSSRAARGAYRVVCLPDCVGVTEGPDTVRKLVAQRERWQRVILETWWANRRMCLNRALRARSACSGCRSTSSRRSSRRSSRSRRRHARRRARSPGSSTGGSSPLVTLADHVRSTARFTTGALLMQSTSERRVYRLSRRRCASCALMPLELFVYRPVMAWARDQGHVAVPPRRQGVAQVRAQRPDGARHERPRCARGRRRSCCSSPSRRTAAVGRGRLRRARGGADPARPLARDRGGARRSRSTGLFAFWFGGAARRRLAESRPGRVGRRPQPPLRASRTGSCSSATARSARSTAASASCSATSARSSSARPAPFPFWPPEHRHEIEAWHAELGARGELVAELTFAHERGRPRPGPRLRAVVVDERGGARATSSPCATSRRATGASGGSPSSRRGTPRRGCSTGGSSRSGSGDAVRRAIQGGTNVTVVLAELAVHGRAGGGVFGRPEALLAVEQLSRRGRARATSSRGRRRRARRGSFPRRTPAGGLEAVARWRAELGDIARRAC